MSSSESSDYDGYWSGSECDRDHIDNIINRPLPLRISAPAFADAPIYVPIKCNFMNQCMDSTLSSLEVHNSINVCSTFSEIPIEKIDSNYSQHIINTDNDLIRICLKNNFFIPLIYQWLPIELIVLISSILNNHGNIKKSNVVCISTLCDVFHRMIEIRMNPENHIWQYAAQTLHNCVNGIIHPFSFPRISHTTCISLQKLFKNTKCYFNIHDSKLRRINYTTYILFQLNEFKLWHSIYKNTPLCHYVNLFLPFTRFNIPEQLIHSVKTFEFKQYIQSINTKSQYLEEIFSNLWVKSSHKHQCRDITQQCNDEDTFFAYFAGIYDCYHWIKFINWDSFFIAGGSVISAIIDSEQCDNSDVDIFSIGLNLNQFSFAIKKFQSELIRHRIGHHTIFLNESIFTFILVCKKPNEEYTIVRLQFIWTCKMATVAQTLSSFDLAASQIAFKPYPVNQIYFTDAFLYFLKTDKCLVYNTNIYRIDKYQGKGVKNFLFKSRKDLPDNRITKSINTEHKRNSKHYMKLQINDNQPFFLSRFSYHGLPSGHNLFSNKNNDKCNLLNEFLSSI